MLLVIRFCIRFKFTKAYGYIDDNIYKLQSMFFFIQTKLVCDYASISFGFHLLLFPFFASWSAYLKENNVILNYMFFLIQIQVTFVKQIIHIQDNDACGMQMREMTAVFASRPSYIWYGMKTSVDRASVKNRTATQIWPWRQNVCDV